LRFRCGVLGKNGDSRLDPLALLARSVPAARSTAPTAFTLLTGSSNQFVSIGRGSTAGHTAIAGYRFFNLNAPSSAGASATLVVNQSGIG
jgi:hypothetical protein